MKNKFNIGDKVQTNFGMAFIINYIQTVIDCDNNKEECVYSGDGGYGVHGGYGVWHESELTLFEEPKPKRRLYQWAYKGRGCWFLTSIVLCEGGLDASGCHYSPEWNEIEKRKFNPDSYIEVDAL